ncbi:hypothetical protein VPH35_021630 [Triticum aestivum]|uniref:uncharacterized protein n=1 Tax=Triticum aestivum TaxID=4565 RepID=UPI001D020558|nr:uncharacterized protein LOC123189261 [Triticum aestivum]XP_044457574.1 uncharacterized protein LOC123189261 [Triticum aestivum]XP_044457575.1 uncharacterized protein LOC123189261 [Triticum aestivum]
MVPITCSTKCSTQVDTTDNVDEVHDAATALDLEPTVDPIHQAVEQLALEQAMASRAEVVSHVMTNTDVDPKAGVQELDALSVYTSTQVMSKADHGVALIISSDPALPVLTMCSTGGLVQDGAWVKPVHLVDKSKTSCLPSIQHGIGQQPWLSPVRVRTRHSRQLFRPSPWPSFRFHLDASYQEEPCSGICRQSQEVLWFSSELVLRLFRDVVFHQVSCCEVISMEEYISCLSEAQLQSRSPPDQAPPNTKALNELAFLNVDMSTSISVDAWLSLRFLGTNHRLIDTAPHAGHWIYLDFSNIGCQGRQSCTCSLVQLMAVAEYFAHWDIIYDFANGLEICRMHTKALQIVDELVSTFQVELCHAGDLECNLPRHCIRIPHVQIFCLSSLQQNTDDSCFAKQLLHEVCFMQSSYKLCAQKAPSVFKFSHKIVRLKLPNYMNEGIPCVQPTYYLEGGSA